MIIGIDIRCLMDREYSGVGEYTHNLLNNLFKIDRENEYRLFYNSLRPARQNLPKWDYPNVRFCGHRWPNKILNFCFRFLGWPKADRMIGGCEVFFVPNLHFIALSNQCRKILTVHDLSFAFFPQFFNLKRKMWHWIIWSASILKKFNHYLAVSDNTADDLSRLLKISREKITTTHLAADESAGEVDLEAVKKKYNLPDEFVLFISTIDPRKNVMGVIRGFERAACNHRRGGAGTEHITRNTNLVLVGAKGWNGGYVKKVGKMIKKSEFKDRIKIVGYVTKEDKPAIYKLAKCLLFPSFYEGFGMPILEAFQNSCPVITSLSSSTSEVAGDAAILVEPNNVAEIARALEMILGDENLRKNLIEKGLARAKEFDWAKTAEATLLSFRIPRVLEGVRNLIKN